MKIIKSRIFKLLIFALIVGFFLGVICFLITKKTDSKNNIITYIDLFKNSNNNLLSLYQCISSNIKYSFYIWIFGIIFIFSFLNLFIIVYKGISIGFMISTVIYTFKIKGVLLALILLLNNMLVLMVFILLSYYSINFAIKSYNAFRNNRLVNFRGFYIKYIYIYLVFIIALIVDGLIETYIYSNLIRFVV